MTLPERIKAARLAYVRAIAAARAEPSPLTWARLKMAARNLNEATAEQAPPPPRRVPTRRVISSPAAERDAREP